MTSNKNNLLEKERLVFIISVLSALPLLSVNLEKGLAEWMIMFFLLMYINLYCSCKPCHYLCMVYWNMVLFCLLRSNESRWPSPLNFFFF